LEARAESNRVQGFAVRPSNVPEVCEQCKLLIEPVSCPVPVLEHFRTSV
jgi:hypothetical protein